LHEAACVIAVIDDTVEDGELEIIREDGYFCVVQLAKNREKGTMKFHLHSQIHIRFPLVLVLAVIFEQSLVQP
jgi:hypothetical protein